MKNKKYLLFLSFVLSLFISVFFIHNIKKSNVKVSIIIPIYKVEKYIDKCFNSAIHQTLKNIEIICIDDGLPDNI